MKQAKVLSDAELKRVLAMLEHLRHAPRNRLAVMLSHLAGLRVGEIASLTVTDVFEPDGTAKDVFLLRAEQTKSKEARRVFVGERLRRELGRYHSSVKPKIRTGVPLIRSQKGGFFSANSLCQLFVEVYRFAGVSGASSHSGRRAFITKLAHSGISAKVIMTLAGHKHLSTTQRYIEVNDEMLRSATNIL